MHLDPDPKQACPTHIAKSNTANHFSVQCGAEGDVKCGGGRGTLKLKISGRIYKEGLKMAAYTQQAANNKTAKLNLEHVK